jgi:hypothetical protein
MDLLMTSFWRQYFSILARKAKLAKYPALIKIFLKAK